MSSTSVPVGGGSLILAWQLKDKRVLIVGGGDVASGRIESVLVADALITLISPREGLHPKTKRLVDISGRITYHDRTFGGSDDLVDVDMVLTAIDDVDRSRQIWAMCKGLKIPVNVADIPDSCDFYFGSQIRKGPLQIMISTNGNGPKLANLIKKRIESNLPDYFGDAVEKVGALRVMLRKRAPGVGGDLGRKRMRWMTGVCTTWEMDELTTLEEHTMKKMLDDGWDKGKVPKPDEIIGKRHTPWQLPRLFLPVASGFLIGAATTAAFFLVRRH